MNRKKSAAAFCLGVGVLLIATGAARDGWLGFLLMIVGGFSLGVYAAWEDA